jgi:hypothetical protein
MEIPVQMVKGEKGALRESNIFVQHNIGSKFILLNRPAALNALNINMIHDLHKAYKEAEHDEHCGLFVLYGAGEKAFCAGGKALYVFLSSPKMEIHPCTLPHKLLFMPPTFARVAHRISWISCAAYAPAHAHSPRRGAARLTAGAAAQVTWRCWVRQGRCRSVSTRRRWTSSARNTPSTTTSAASKTSSRCLPPPSRTLHRPVPFRKLPTLRERRPRTATDVQKISGVEEEAAAAAAAEAVASRALAMANGCFSDRGKSAGPGTGVRAAGSRAAMWARSGSDLILAYTLTHT